jgi:hypothetical protein
VFPYDLGRICILPGKVSSFFPPFSCAGSISAAAGSVFVSSSAAVHGVFLQPEIRGSTDCTRYTPAVIRKEPRSCPDSADAQAFQPVALLSLPEENLSRSLCPDEFPPYASPRFG